MFSYFSFKSLSLSFDSISKFISGSGSLNSAFLFLGQSKFCDSLNFPLLIISLVISSRKSNNASAFVKKGKKAERF